MISFSPFWLQIFEVRASNDDFDGKRAQKTTSFENAEKTAPEKIVPFVIVMCSPILAHFYAWVGAIQPVKCSGTDVVNWAVCWRTGVVVNPYVSNSFAATLHWSSASDWFVCCWWFMRVLCGSLMRVLYRNFVTSRDLAQISENTHPYPTASQKALPNPHTTTPPKI